MLKDFTATRKEIRTSLKKIYCFWGEEDFFKQSLLGEIIRATKGYDILRFSSDVKIGQIEEILCEDDFFNRKRLVIISEFDSIEKKDKIIKLFCDKSLEDVVVVLLCEKELKKLAEVPKICILECKKIKVYDNENLEKFINSVVKGTGYEIEPNALQYLITICSNDLSAIVNELRKVFCLKAKLEKISIDDLRRVVYLRPQENIFQLLDLIVNQDEDKCLSVIEDFELTGQSPIGIVHFLYENFKTLCIIYDMSKNNFDLKEITSSIKLPFFIVKNLQKNAQKLGLKRLLSFFKELCDIDQKQKSSDIDGFILLKSFMIKACRSS